MKGLTSFTAQIGNVLSKIKEQNRVLDDARRLSNPTFLEIIEELKEDDRTLCSMLLLWYSQKYLDDPIDYDGLFDKINSSLHKSDKIDYRCSGGSCGSVFDEDEDELNVYGGAC